MGQQNAPPSTVWGSPKDASRSGSTSPVLSGDLTRSCQLISQTIPLVSVEHCAHQSVSAALLSDLQRLQHGSALAGRGQCSAVSSEGGEHRALTIGNQRGTTAARPDNSSRTVKARIQTLPSLRVIWTSTVTPSHYKCFCSWWPSHLPWPSSELSCQSFMSQMHPPPVSQGEQQLLFPSEPKEILHCWELSCWKIVSCMFQAVSACKGKGTIFANRFHITYSVFIIIWLKFICMVF